MSSAQRTSWPKGHVIHMSLEASRGREISVARCDCGWENRVAFRNRFGHRRQDDACEAHWSNVERTAA